MARAKYPGSIPISDLGETMKKLLPVFLGGLLSITSLALAQDIPPIVIVEIDGIQFQVPTHPGEKPGSLGFGMDSPRVISSGGQRLAAFQFDDDSSVLNPDPVISYGVAVVDFGAPSSFSFLFFTPIVPTGPAVVVNSGVVGGLTDTTGDGVSITPTGAKLQTSALYFPETPMGVDVGDAESNPGTGVFSYGPYTAGPIVGPAGVWTGLAVSVDFSLSGGGDVAALTGFARVEAPPRDVPDGGPGVPLAAAALFGLAMAARFARRSAA
jgi:hypothetical protein